MSVEKSGGALPANYEALLDRQEAAQFRTQLFQTESMEIAEKGKAFQAVHDAILALISSITGR
jgi:hypothetical protein